MKIENGLVFRDNRHVGSVQDGVFSVNSDARKFTPGELRHIAALIELEGRKHAELLPSEQCPNYMRF